MQEVIDYPDGRYIGNVENDLPNGRGTYNYKDGSYYKGDWKNGKRHGIGCYGKNKDEIEYLCFIDDCPIKCIVNGKLIGSIVSFNDKNITKIEDIENYIGDVISINQNGDYYVGKWSNCAKNGSGSIYSFDCELKFKGFFINGKRFLKAYVIKNSTKIELTTVDDIESQKIQIIYAPNHTYIGEINKLGKRSGYGRHIDHDKIEDGFFIDDKYVAKRITASGTCEKISVDYEGDVEIEYPNGNTYTGQWNKNGRNGYGIYTNKKDRYIFNGLSKNNQRVSGKCKYFDESTYEGKFENNVFFDENGKYQYNDGCLYEGSYKNGYRNGLGTYTYPNGYSFTGPWDNDLLNGRYTVFDSNKEKVLELNYDNNHLCGEGICFSENGSFHFFKDSSGIHHFDYKHACNKSLSDLNNIAALIRFIRILQNGIAFECTNQDINEMKRCLWDNALEEDIPVDLRKIKNIPAYPPTPVYSGRTKSVPAYPSRSYQEPHATGPIYSPSRRPSYSDLYGYDPANRS